MFSVAFAPYKGNNKLVVSVVVVVVVVVVVLVRATRL